MSRFNDFFNNILKKEKSIIQKRTEKNKSSLEKRIETRKDIIEILESINDQNPKIEEMIKKENEIIEILNKKIKFLDFNISFFNMLEEMFDLPKEKNIDKDIEMIVKELNKDGISIDK